MGYMTQEIPTYPDDYFMKGNRGKLQHPKLQTGSPRGTFSRSDIHPIYGERLVFFYYKPNGDEYWAKAEVKKAHDKRIREQYQRHAGYYKFMKTEWGKANPEKVAALSARRSRKLKNNIKLHKDAQDALHAIYALRATLTLSARSVGSSEAFHVDHIYPLKPKKVLFREQRIRPYTGLHAPWNVQILEASENSFKSNKTPTLCHY